VTQSLPDVSTERSRHGLIGRFFRHPPKVDAGTRDFWASSDAPRAIGGSARSDRLAEMLRAHESGRDRENPGRPRGNPAFAEALFVELMRAHQYRRAFEQLSSDCQRMWGSAEGFATAQGAGAMSRVRGVRVNDVRYLPEWTDPGRGATYHEVAELQVEYTIGERDPGTVLRRVVHLVPDAGRWRSLCYPV
jgi:hypothetical protein